MANDKQHFSIYLLYFFFVEMSFAHGLIEVFIFCLFVYNCWDLRVLYIQETNYF